MRELPPRLERVYQLVIEGSDNGSIAQALNLTINTVEQYITQILRIYEVNSRAQLIANHYRDKGRYR
jgi:DNA-binding NarL/FixJ family response regulator